VAKRREPNYPPHFPPAHHPHLPELGKRKLDALRRLFEYWMAAALEAAPELKEEIDWMVFDGFCPHYFGKGPRVLFIGREAR